MSELTNDERHTKRLELEPIIFNILTEKYLDILKHFWNSYIVPKDSNKAVVIIERRIHPNLEFILYNAAYFARGWSIVIVCSNINKEYIQSLLNHNLENVHVLEMFKDNPSPEIGKREYNILLQSTHFYEALPSEHILLMEMDTYLRNHIPLNLLQFDYVASPYAWDETVSGGGLSLRKKSTMIHICNTCPQLDLIQDVYACNGIKALGYTMPSFEEGITYFAESCHYEDPIGLHQWWTFWNPDNSDDSNLIFKEYTTLMV